MGLPIACYAAIFLCNEVSGCPVPSLLHPSKFSLQQLKRDAGWPEGGLAGLTNWGVTTLVLGYYALHLFMQVGLPGQEIEGIELRSGGRLKYKFNCNVIHVWGNLFLQLAHIIRSFQLGGCHIDRGFGGHLDPRS